MAYLGDGEKVFIGIVIAFLVIFGIITLRSQIKYDSPFAVFSDGSSAPAKTAEKTPVVAQTTNAVVSENLNLRPSPDRDSTPIKVLQTGSVVGVISVENGWAKVIDDTGREGYVANNYLRY